MSKQTLTRKTVQVSVPVPSRQRKPWRGGASRRPGRWWTPWVFAGPGLILFALVIVYPLLRSFEISFFNWSLVPTLPSTFVGLANYIQAFHDQIFWTSVANAGIYLVLTVPISTVLSLLFAALLQSAMPGRALFRVLYYIPVVTGWVVVALLFHNLFTTDGGAVNWFLQDFLHVTNQPIPWLEGRWTGLITAAIMGIWKGFGGAVVLFLAAMSAIEPQLYEAADIDGANAFNKFRHVTLPGIRGTIIFSLIVGIIGAFNVFPQIFLLTGGGPAQSTQVPLVYMYQQAFSFLKFGYASALSFILAIIIAGVSYLQYRFTREKKDVLR